MNHIPYALKHTDSKGRLWKPYIVDFESPDGKYMCHIYAISPEHAELQLQALKETGRIEGCVGGVLPYEEQK